MPSTLPQRCGPDAEPHYVICGPHRYRVLVLSDEDYLATVNTDPDDDRSDTLGICDRVAHILYLRSVWKETVCSDSKMLESLLHEVLHIAWGNSGARHKHEEEAVCVLTTQLLDIFQKNRWLVDFLSSPLDAADPEPAVELQTAFPSPAEQSLLDIRDLLRGQSFNVSALLHNRIIACILRGLGGQVPEVLDPASQVGA